MSALPNKKNHKKSELEGEKNSYSNSVETSVFLGLLLTYFQNSGILISDRSYALVLHGPYGKTSIKELACSLGAITFKGVDLPA